MKNKIKLLNVKNKVLFTYERKNNTIRQTLRRAIDAGVNLTGLRLKGVDLTGFKFGPAILDGSEFYDCGLDSANFKGTALREAHFIHSDLRSTIFQRAVGRGLYFYECNAKLSKFIQCDLIDSRLDKGSFENSLLENCNMQMARVQTNISEAHFRRVDLSRARLTQAKFGDVRFSEANLTSANLSSAKLDEACFSTCILQDADFTDSVWDKVVLEYSRVAGASFSSTKLRGYETEDGKTVAVFGPVGSRDDYLEAIPIKHKDKYLYRTGCFFGTKAELLSEIKASHGDNEAAKKYRAAITAISRM